MQLTILLELSPHNLRVLTESVKRSIEAQTAFCQIVDSGSHIYRLSLLLGRRLLLVLSSFPSEELVHSQVPAT
jgi:hypothetical protein